MSKLCDCKKIAIIDTETNFDDEVISIGVVIADAITYEIIEKRYLIVYPECTKPAMYSDELYHPNTIIDLKSNRTEVIDYLESLLRKHKIEHILAYNSSFDEYHLYDLGDYDWHDIMRVAAYKQYNPTLRGLKAFSSGRLVRGYGLDNTLKRLRKYHNLEDYSEVHNALTDAIDELEVVRLLGHKIYVYDRQWQIEQEELSKQKTKEANRWKKHWSGNVSSDKEKINKQYEIMYMGKKYTSKTDAYKTLFPNVDPNAIRSSVQQRMKFHKISWEEALEMTLEKYGDRHQTYECDGVVFQTKKDLYQYLFPDRRYESVSNSISQLMNNKNMTLEDAVNYLLNNSKGYKKEIEYNGVFYPSIRKLSKAFELSPSDVCYYAKNTFDGDYAKAVDYLVSKNRTK